MAAVALIVEEVTPGESYGKVMLRMSRYLQAGIPVVLLVDPEERVIMVYRRGKQFQFLEPAL
jgi:Uma2 family endonuclease